MRRDGVVGKVRVFLSDKVSFFLGDMSGNGMANSRPAALRLTGDLVGDLEEEGVGDEGVVMERMERPLGDAEASVWVKAETLTSVRSSGRSA